LIKLVLNEKIFNEWKKEELKNLLINNDKLKNFTYQNLKYYFDQFPAPKKEINFYYQEPYDFYSCLFLYQKGINPIFFRN
jgi:hypothetical protein